MEVERNDLCDRFQQAVADDQKWMGQIFMPGVNGTLVNIVPLFHPSTIQEIEFKMAGYPKFSSFLFDGFIGIDDTDRIIDALKSSAAMSGSRIRANKRKLKKGGNKLVSIDLFLTNRSITQSVTLSMRTRFKPIARSSKESIRLLHGKELLELKPIL